MGGTCFCEASGEKLGTFRVQRELTHLVGHFPFFFRAPFFSYRLWEYLTSREQGSAPLFGATTRGALNFPPTSWGNRRELPPFFFTHPGGAPTIFLCPPGGLPPKNSRGRRQKVPLEGLYKVLPREYNSYTRWVTYPTFFD